MAQTKAVRNARELLAAQGRNGDTELAHVSPAERRLMRAWQGAEDVNPHTGLPEYFSFKKVLKGVAKAAGAIAGGIVGGPAGAAVGGALATKLTGGSWKSALGTGLLSGISAYGLQQSGAGDWAGIGALGKDADLLGRVADTAATTGAKAAESSIDWKSLLPVAAVGIGALGGGAKPPKIATGQQATAVSEVPSWETTTRPLDRDYRRYGEDYYTYGQNAGEHEFYDEVNPVRLAEGGGPGSGSRDRSPSGPGRPGGASGGGGGNKGPDKAMQDKIKAAYSHPSRQFDTEANAKTVRDIINRGDPTTVGGMMARRPGMLQGISNIVKGQATPSDAFQVGMQGIGMFGGAPLAAGASFGIGMGNSVKDVQTLRDMGLLGGTTRTDPVMGRTDVIDGHSYSMGNPAAGDRYGESVGPGRMAPGHSGGGDEAGAKVLSALTQTFNAPPAAAPAGPDLPAPVVSTGAPRGRTQLSPEDYYRYGERPEFEFFDEINPVTSAATGGTIKGKGSGQSDEIPALLSDNEHVLDADIVAAIGDGSSDEGHRRIEAFKKKLRKEKRSAPAGKIPPATKGLGSYFGRAA